MKIYLISINSHVYVIDDIHGLIDRIDFINRTYRVKKFA